MRARWIIQGVVQGVGFRMWAAREARSLGLAGWVCNRSEGSVELEAEGEETGIGALEVRLRRGPPNARVHVCRRTRASDDVLPTTFEVRRT
ncbi:MAG: acylphosphatase [Longimicrobiales bacterium]